MGTSRGTLAEGQTRGRGRSGDTGVCKSQMAGVRWQKSPWLKCRLSFCEA